MSNNLTIFYSWQSDTPSKFNRNFIEKALCAAIKRLQSNAELEAAKRIEIDKDTKGLTGSPPITESLLKKIEECSVFVADLTFVGESYKQLVSSNEKASLLSNPNVLLEYGYALKCHSHSKLIGIMNAAFGKPDDFSLPFNLRHRRWPLTYCLDNQFESGKKSEFEKLTKELADAIGAILSKQISAKTETMSFIPQKTTKNDAVFYDDTTNLVPEINSLKVPEGGKMYLRLYPKFSLSPIQTGLDAKKLANKGLKPLGQQSGYEPERNEFGAIVYSTIHREKLYHLTQLFLSKEIWGIDARALNANYLKTLEARYSEIINVGYVEEYFTEALQDYLSFAKNQLKLHPPLKIKAGLTGVKNYQLISNEKIIGRMLNDAISWDKEIASYEIPAYEILAPFFDRIWEECGATRPPSRHIWLAKQFNNHFNTNPLPT